MRVVSVLYVDPLGPYPKMADVDPWDERRNAINYQGKNRVVVHPPCGPWGLLSAMSRHQDKDLAPLGVQQVRRWGGVLEHPVGSKLWEAEGLPAVGAPADEWGGYTIQVEQVSWGHCCRKPTLLYFVRVPRDAVEMTRRYGGVHTHAISSKSRRGDLLAPSARMRRRTPPAFAQWLVDCARLAQ